MSKTGEWTHEQLVNFHEVPNYEPWDNGSGGFRFVFTGDTCGNCKHEANVPHGPGWFCPCGHYNLLSFGNLQKTFEHPQYGPTRDAIIKARRQVIDAHSQSNDSKEKETNP